jgi:hypothetical protein
MLNAADLLEWLEQRPEAPYTAADIVAILRKPWHWTTEYNRMRGEQWHTAGTKVSP